MIQLSLAAILWLAVHLGIAGTTLRRVIVTRIGVNGFRGIFSIASIAAIIWLVLSYNAAPTVQLWTAPAWLHWVLALVMLPAFVLFVASFVRNPTAAGGEKYLGQDITGIQRITRHPMMVSYTIWAAVHCIGRGDVASLLFFGAFLITCVVGMPSVDIKTKERDAAAWAQLSATTSIVPFMAILTRRNRLVFSEIGWLVPAIGLAIWVEMLIFHQRIFGIAALPV
ncbi:NnrU domain-containing protein [Rhodovastum atsumiense]|uniref:NnrU domain-containing protein n=1 Tax=Rhodovastum atsumiense TaxID=504468 RepID=A0A5M6IQF8_9PROT|nr:NnrU family protein [Rhodovastum atsumiense]KAA5610169.1 hypothetical protein F1189_20755 [Rhodovastum atsumiense]CAH2599262.1 NnrU domain-containing protein [Rhodovastum atsumiense]